MATFYDQLDPDFLENLKRNYPVEYHLFSNYAKGINTDLWTDDIRYDELAWKHFDSYSRKAAKDLMSEGCQDLIENIYGPESWLSKVLNGLGGVLLGIHSDAGTINSAASLTKLTQESINIMINGPAVINEQTWTEAFGPYTPGLW